jgi:hypothetical protein
MDTILDLIGAAIIAAIVMVGIANLNIYSSQMQFKSNSDLQLQMNAKTLADIIESDLRKIGYGHKGASPIITADPQEIKFCADIDSNNVVDTVSYSLSDSTAVSYTQNPSERILYRVVDGDTLKAPSLGITNLKFSYLNIWGNVTTVPDSIKYIKAELWVQSPTKVYDNNQQKYLFTYWELTINPRNI